MRRFEEINGKIWAMLVSGDNGIITKNFSRLEIEQTVAGDSVRIESKCGIYEYTQTGIVEKVMEY